MTSVCEGKRDCTCTKVDDLMISIVLPIALWAQHFLSSTQTGHHEDSNVTICYH